jgi:hypothetical protein
MSVFNGANPNGTWRLYVRDDFTTDSGFIGGGWSLSVTSDRGAMVVTDTLPVGASFIGASGTGWSCTPLGAQVRCIAPAFASGIAPSIVLSASAPITSGIFTNTANVASNLADPAPLNNQAVMTSTLGPPGALGGTVVAAPASNPISGSLIIALDAIRALTYTTLTNGTGQYLLDKLPVGTYNITASAVGYDPASAAGVMVGSALTTTQNFTLALHQADLALTISGPTGSVLASAALTYTLRITNSGPDTITSTVTVSDGISSGAVINGAAGLGWSCTSAALAASCTRLGLPVGPAPAIVVTLTTPASLGVFTNTATITSTVSDPILFNNQAIVTGTIQGIYLPLILR